MTALTAIERRALRVLRMVGELHTMGYQKIRVCPGMAPSGMYWRCAVTSRQHIAGDNGAMICDDDDWNGPTIAAYSTGSDNEYFGWTDAKRATAPQLAELFVERYPRIAEEGRGQDWNYAGWFVQMLGQAKSGAFPIAYQEIYGPAPVAWLETTRPEVYVLMPPGGTGRRIGSADLWGPWPRPRHPIRVEIRGGYTMANLVARTLEQVRAAGLEEAEQSRFTTEARRAPDREALQRVVTCWFDVYAQTR